MAEWTPERELEQELEPKWLEPKWLRMECVVVVVLVVVVVVVGGGGGGVTISSE